jgi:hypothetical protein
VDIKISHNYFLNIPAVFQAAGHMIDNVQYGSRIYCTCCACVGIYPCNGTIPAFPLEKIQETEVSHAVESTQKAQPIRIERTKQQPIRRRDKKATNQK